jgi:hypothetical protein
MIQTPYNRIYEYNYSVSIEGYEPAFKEVTFLLAMKPRGECHLTLKGLWEVDMFGELKTGSKFSYGEYFQHTFKSDPRGQCLSGILHDFIIHNRSDFDFKLESIYSTYEPEDGYSQSPDVIKFLKKRVKRRKAEWVEDLHRHKILW